MTLKLLAFALSAALYAALSAPLYGQMTDASRVKRILHHSAKISMLAKRHAPYKARAKIASQVKELRKSLKALERYRCSANRKLYRHAARHALRALRGLTLTARRLPSRAQRHWRKANGDDRVARMTQLLKPLINAHPSMSFRRVGHCMDRHSSDARTSERMVVI